MARHQATAPSPNIHRDQVRRMYDNGRWMIIPRDFLAVMTMEEVVVLTYLINVGQLRKTDWFQCTTAKMCSNLRLTVRQHDRILAGLTRKKLIIRKMKGQPAKRHFWIDYVRLDKKVTASQSRDLDDDFSPHGTVGG